MNRSTLIALSTPLLLGLGCSKTDSVTKELAYPDLSASQGLLEFGAASAGSPVERTIILSNDGEMTMGVDEIAIPGNMGANFLFSYVVTEMECPVEASSGDTGETTSVKAVDAGTGEDDTGAAPANVLFLLEPGCTIPIHVTFTPVDLGEVWAGLIVNSSQAEVPEDAPSGTLPEYLRDPTQWRQEIWLHGIAERSQGTLVVRPRSYDFGYVNPGETDPSIAYIGLENVGSGDVTLSSVVLSDECDTSFSLEMAPPADYVLVPDESTLAQVRFDPTDDNAAYCQLVVGSDDPASPEIFVTLTGNSGSDPNNHPPSVAIRSPENGYRYSTIRDMELELNIFDVDQPAPSLSCRIKSAVLQNAVLADCTAPDASGHFWVSIPSDSFDPGSDTIVVTVTDGNGVSAEASVSVVIDAAYPSTDDDGDGFGTVSIDEQPTDCDETNRYTYPEAAEVFDGADNDCDGLVDEGTDGYDDDGDDVSEDEGDCNDYNERAYPGAFESPDGVDNDCDGTVDEGTTLYDNDGDGYAGVNNDCDDTDPTVNPTAEELCDGFDNDCDGLIDSADGCIASSSAPLLIGELRPSQNACEEGDRISIEAKVFDPDGQVPTLAWQDDSGQTGLFDNQAASTVNWVCPTLADGSGGKAFNVWVTVTDPDGQQDYNFVKIAVYPDGYGLYDPYTYVEEVPKSGCSTTGGAPALGLAALGALVGLARRRR